MKRLIINADDFGFNKEITDGIIEAHKAGTVTSTTLMVNMPAAEYAADVSRSYPKLSVGIHLTLTIGKPISKPEMVKDLLDKNGYFKNHIEMFRLANRCKLPAGQIERELSAQIEKFLSLGIIPSHSDSHHHIADCLQIHPIKIKLLKRYGITKARTQRGFYRYDKLAENKVKAMIATVKMNCKRLPYRLYYEILHLHNKLAGIKVPDERYGLAKVISDRKLEFDVEGFEHYLATMPKKTVEMCTHPGLLSDDPLDRPEFRRVRVKELEILKDDKLMELIRKYEVQLINFNDI